LLQWYGLWCIPAAWHIALRRFGDVMGTGRGTGAAYAMFY